VGTASTAEPRASFARVAAQIKTELLPAYQRAVDNLDADDLKTVGTRLLMAWSAVEDSQTPNTDDAGASSEYGRLHNLAVQSTGARVFHG
jgi:hypothetical protein